MPSSVDDYQAQNKLARIAGGLYLAFILASVFASALGNIGLRVTRGRSRRPSLRMPGRSVWVRERMASAFLFLLAAWGLYILLRPIRQHLASLFLILNAVDVAIQCTSMLPLISALPQRRRGQPHAGLLGDRAGE